jgi:hypothetical protein
LLWAAQRVLQSALFRLLQQCRVHWHLPVLWVFARAPYRAMILLLPRRVHFH